MNHDGQEDNTSNDKKDNIGREQKVVLNTKCKKKKSLINEIFGTLKKYLSTLFRI